TTSLAPASPPTRICPSMRGAAVRAPFATTITRDGCSRLASFAASIASSSCSSSSATITSVRTRPSATAPPRSRSSTIFLFNCDVVVDGRSMITGASSALRNTRTRSAPRDRGLRECGSRAPSVLSGTPGTRSAPRDRGLRDDGSRAPPLTSCALQHAVRRRRAPASRRIRLRNAALGPVLQNRVEDLPRQLDLLVHREQRRLTQQHVEDQPLVGLRRALRERVPVAEVHRDVADLHGRARHLRAEPHRHALVRLHTDDERVLPELLGGRRV